jgi:anthranilate synthase component II
LILLIDNYDSFTWNLVQAFAGFGAEVEVRRNDALTAREALDRGARGIVLSPGPGRPREAGICAELLRLAPESLPILGVCLGHQALVESLGGALEVDPIPVHGRASDVRHDSSGLLAGLPDPFAAGRYHSLRARRSSVPNELVVNAWTEDGLVMGVRHRSLPRHGVQFHPESILSPLGPRILGSFLELCGEELVARGGSEAPLIRAPRP